MNAVRAFVIGQALALAAVEAPSAEFHVPDAERAKIEAAVPARPRVVPAAPRRLLVFDLNVGYPGHASIGHAEVAFTAMGAKTGAFATEISRDPAVFRRERLERFDAVFFNNTVGNCFEDAVLRQNLVEFVYRGGGLLGVHGTTVAFTRWPGAIEDWPEFGIMLGGRGARHRASNERVIVKLDSPEHPLNLCFGAKPFEYASEFFRVDGPYSRERVRVLFSIDTARTDLAAGGARPERADNDYALAWVRNYGRGRVCYSTIAHAPADFMNSTLLEFYLGAAQFVLGDLPAPTTPSAKLTPALLAQEKLNWRVAAGAAAQETFFDSIDRAAALRVGYVMGSSAQKVAVEIEGNLDWKLSADAMRAIRLKLDAAAVRFLAYRLDPALSTSGDVRAAFAFARAMGVETIVAERFPGESKSAYSLCREYSIDLAVREKDGVVPTRVPQDAPDASWTQEKRRLGICADADRLLAAGDEAANALGLLGTYIKAFELRGGSNALKNRDDAERFLRLVVRSARQPVFIVAGESGRDAEAAESLRALNELTVKIAE